VDVFSEKNALFLFSPKSPPTFMKFALQEQDSAGIRAIVFSAVIFFTFCTGFPLRIAIFSLRVPSILSPTSNAGRPSWHRWNLPLRLPVREFFFWEARFDRADFSLLTDPFP